MKKILLGFIAIVLLTFVESCNQTSKKNEFNRDNYKALVSTELNSRVRKDTIILGYIFGMTAKEVKSHNKKLIKNKIIRQIDNDLVFDLKIAGRIISFTYKTEIYNDKLNFLRATTEDASAIEVNVFLNEKYGNYQFIFKDNLGSLQTTDYNWISGNREIKSIQISGAFSETVLIFDDQSNQKPIDVYSTSIVAKDDNSTNARVMVWKFVKDKLKNPSTSDFGRFSPKKTQSGSWKSKSYVDSQNSFGAIIRTNFDCEIKYNSKSSSW